jgi:bifunctional enzyme CysN/CysC
VIDGQNLRLGLSRDLGFAVEDRSEALRRGAEVARLMNQAGLITLLAFVAPSAQVRERAREVVGAERFLVVYLDAPLEVCRARDTEGIYDLAESGEVGVFPGISSPYDAPAAPDLRLDTATLGVEECVDRVLEVLRVKRLVSRA